MQLFRTVMLSMVATLTLLAPLGSPPAADAQTLRRHFQGQRRIYRVYYRTCAESPWVCYGGYYWVSQAVQAVEWFQANGYDAFYQ